ncbi:3-isopropylmalate dehydratase small subunit (plasmid) [Buchnera aphidicola (Kurisakia onigurumii)]|uniref:3-isopropylmalate dehydratase small subunit n=1 Tax=Buchnera aphidicola TaxID=9 RepID=UPI0031B736C6
MNQFSHYESIITPIDLPNIDTDAIIPKQFLKKVTKKGFGKHLFNNWRYIDKNNSIINPDFPINKKEYKNSSILLTRDNFGCGSSREHAVWALKDYGFQVIISSSFSDIFYINGFNNQILLIQLNKIEINEIFSIIKKKSSTMAFINLIENFVLVNNKKYNFKINDFYKLCILNNLDNIDYTMQHKEKIIQYEKKIPNFFK